MSKKKRHPERNSPSGKNKPNNKPSIKTGRGQPYKKKAGFLIPQPLKSMMSRVVGSGPISFKPKWQHIVLIILLTAIVYSNTLQNKFVYDDISTISDNNLIRNLKNIPLFFTKPIISSSQKMDVGYRPLLMASFAVNYKIGVLNVVGYHLVNILFHTANAILVYLLVIILSSIATGSKSVLGENNNRYIIALFTSLIFAVHPINSEAVNYIWQRSVLMSTCFFLIATILFLINMKRNKIILLLFSMISYILAFMSKEIAITFPIIIILIDLYFISDFKKDVFIKNLKRYHFPFIFITFVYFVFRSFGTGVIKEFGSPIDKLSTFNYLITQFSVIIKYLKLIIIPSGLSVDHVFPVSGSITDIKVLFSFVVIVLIILISIRLIKVSKTVSLFMLWFFIALIPTSSILPLKIIMNEHRLYLPGIGIIAAFVALLFSITPEKFYKKYLYAPLLIIIIVLTVITFNRNTDWKDGFTLWSKTLQTNPDSVTALNNRGYGYLSEGSYDRAIVDFNKAIVIDPRHFNAYNNRGIVYGKKGFHKKAKEDFDKAIDINSENIEAYCNRGASYGKQGLYNRAIMDFNKAINLNPEYANAYMNIGILYWKKGIADKTIEYINKAIKLKPETWQYYYTRSNIYRNTGKAYLAQKDEEKARTLQMQQQ